jgi:membrane protease YdiL (CAAX protease family)
MVEQVFSELQWTSLVVTALLFGFLTGWLGNPFFSLVFWISFILWVVILIALLFKRPSYTQKTTLKGGSKD